MHRCDGGLIQALVLAKSDAECGVTPESQVGIHLKSLEVIVSQSIADIAPSNVAANAVFSSLTQTAPGALPATYIEADATQRGEAKIGHILGIFGILGTGIYYLLKREAAGMFV